MALLIKLKIGICIIDQNFSYYNTFGEYRRHSFFTGYTNCHRLWSVDSKYLKCISVSLKLLEAFVWKVKWSHCRFSFTEVDLHFGYRAKLRIFDNG